MSLETPNFESSQEKPENKDKQERIKLAKEFYESGEVFSFPGIDDEAYATLKDEEEFLKEQLPEDSFCPIDELKTIFQVRDMEVIFQESGNIFMVPTRPSPSEPDTQKYGLFPRHLKMTSDMDEGLKRLIKADKMK